MFSIVRGRVVKKNEPLTLRPTRRWGSWRRLHFDLMICSAWLSGPNVGKTHLDVVEGLHCRGSENLLVT